MRADPHDIDGGLDYDEFGLFHENAEEVGLTFSGPPEVKRISFEAPSGNRLSAIRWGSEIPEVVFVHGGAQNAHTWDTVALALGRPALAVDLPGHGRSEWRADKRYRPQEMSEDVAALIESVTPAARLLVGMSLGGLTSTVISAERGDLIDELVLIDITPGVNKEKAKDIIDFIAGPEEFESFDEILERTVQFNPTRSESSLRRGVLHNARPREDGKWVWRYDLPASDRGEDLEHRFADLWDAIGDIEAPLSLYQGATSPVVDTEDVEKLLRLKPDAIHHVIEGAGHSIQGDQPLMLAKMFERTLGG